MSGHPSEAETAVRRAVDLAVKTYGQAHLATATAMLEQAGALRRLGRKSLARDIEKQANAYLRTYSTTSMSRFTVSIRDLKTAGTR
jgi:hypothetical protein